MYQTKETLASSRHELDWRVLKAIQKKDIEREEASRKNIEMIEIVGKLLLVVSLPMIYQGRVPNLENGRIQQVQYHEPNADKTAMSLQLANALPIAWEVTTERLTWMIAQFIEFNETNTCFRRWQRPLSHSP